MSAATRGPSAKTTLLISIAILLAAGAVLVLIYSTEPAAERTGATRQSAMLVETVRAERGSYRPEIRVLGTVEAASDVVLSPRVTGEVVARHRAFTPGEFVTRGDVLLRIDPADFRHRLDQRRSELRQAESDLALEQGRVDVAKQDYALLDESLEGESRALVLREPQLQAARARVDSARAAVAQAELDLARTTLRAPFAAQILSRNVDVGSHVAPGDDLGRLVGIDAYWVAASVPVGQLPWLQFPDGKGREASPVRIHNRSAWAAESFREGRLFRLVGALEPETRMARVLIAVDDPLARKPRNAGAPPLMIGAFVEVRIQGRPLIDVVRLDRDYVRQNDRVWLMEDGKLRIQPVRVRFRDARYAYVSEGLAGGEAVVTTNLARVSEGAPLQLQGQESRVDAPAGPGGDTGTP